MTKVFTIDELKSVINMKDVVESVDRTFKGLAEGVVINPTKVTLDLGENAPYPPYDGFFNAMPAYIGYQDVAGTNGSAVFWVKKKSRSSIYQWNDPSGQSKTWYI